MQAKARNFAVYEYSYIFVHRRSFINLSFKIVTHAAAKKTPRKLFTSMVVKRRRGEGRWEFFILRLGVLYCVPAFTGFGWLTFISLLPFHLPSQYFRHNLFICIADVSGLSPCSVVENIWATIIGIIPPIWFLLFNFNQFDFDPIF